MIVLPKSIIQNIVDYLPYYQQIQFDKSRISRIKKQMIYKIMNWWKIKTIELDMANEYMEPINSVRSYLIIKYPKNKRVAFIINSFAFAKSQLEKQLIIDHLNNYDDYNYIFKLLVNRLDIDQITNIQYINHFY